MLVPFISSIFIHEQHVQMLGLPEAVLAVMGSAAATEGCRRERFYKQCCWCLAVFAGFGSLKSLVKLQASYNPFEFLPDGLWDLPALELFRLAVGDLQHWSAGLGGYPWQPG